MKENFKYFGKLSLTGVFTLIKIYAATIISTILAIFTCVSINLTHLAISGSGSKAVHTGAATGIPYLFQLIREYPIQSLIYALLVASLFIIIPMGIRYTIRKLANKVILERKDDILIPLLEKVGNSVKEKTPESLMSVTKFAQAKVLMLKTVKASNENKWLKKAAGYGIKKVDSLEIDFEKPDLNIFDEIKIKALAYLEQISTPSKNWFLIAIAIQWLMVLVFYLLTSNRI